MYHYVYTLGVVHMATTVKVCKWGNGLGIRLPRDFASQRAITEGAIVAIDQIQVQPTTAQRHSRRKLKDLLKNYAPPPPALNLPAVGRELL